MDQKTISWVSYITFVGWIIALVSYNESVNKSSLAKFHLRQSFGIMATAFGLYIGMFMLIFIMPFLFFILSAIGIAFFVFLILGWKAAYDGEEKSVPFVGDFYQKTFTFIS